MLEDLLGQNLHLTLCQVQLSEVGEAVSDPSLAVALPRRLEGLAQVEVDHSKRLQPLPAAPVGPRRRPGTSAVELQCFQLPGQQHCGGHPLQLRWVGQAQEQVRHGVEGRLCKNETK